MGVSTVEEVGNGLLTQLILLGTHVDVVKL